ncbi:50S ribosomal protein L32 [Patescibacteria group bacterium]|nr:50S ribosomal protein L32 [Patescibacteria group bacterium]
MGLPGHRRTSSHKRRRASHFALKPAHLTKCTNCQQPVVTHQACANCGYYKGRQVLEVKLKSKALKAKVAEVKQDKKDKKEAK